MDYMPANGNGFIYILSNPALVSYKVGLTRKPIAERLSGLNNTSIPEDFSLERLFEIKEMHLEVVESRAHEKLKKKGRHHGKEYFFASLDECVEAVQDAIYSVSGDYADELIGMAKKRAAEAEKLAAIKRQNEEKRMKILQAENSSIDHQRRILIEDLRKNNPERNWGWFFASMVLVVLYCGEKSNRDIAGGIFVLGLLNSAALFLRVSEGKLKRKAAEKIPYKVLSDIPEINVTTSNTAQKVSATSHINRYQNNNVNKIANKKLSDMPSEIPAVKRPDKKIPDLPQSSLSTSLSIKSNNNKYINTSIKWCLKCDHRLDASLSNRVTCRNCGEEYEYN